MKHLSVFLYVCNMLCLGLHYFNHIQANNYKLKTNSSVEKFFLATTLFLILSSPIIITLADIVKSFWGYFILNCYLLVFFAIISIAYLNKRNRYIFTARALRMYLLYTLMLIGSGVIALIKSMFAFFGAIFLILIMSPGVVIVAYKLILPFEKLNNNKYIKGARIYLENNSSLIKIGITGSFGKTSTKNILYHFLSSNYNVSATKASYNTPLGIARAVQEINKATDIFIAEMGARYIGDIKELSSLVKPKYAIITGVTRQHLETFKTISNIYKEKQELINNMPLDGFCVFNAENSYTRYMYYKCKTEKYLVGFNNNCDMYAEDIKSDLEGSQFTLNYGDKKLECSTRLLGRHNILNILLATAMAKKFNISDTELVDRIKSLQPIKHRMELLKPPNGILIIDDSYNCNIDGAISALEVVKGYAGRKIIFTQGIVELGTNNQHSVNNFLGRIISKIADIVILCGINAKAIKSGLMDGKFSGEIKVYKTLEKAQHDFRNFLKVGDLLLLQNDLPDNI